MKDENSDQTKDGQKVLSMDDSMGGQLALMMVFSMVHLKVKLMVDLRA